MSTSTSSSSSTLPRINSSALDHSEVFRVFFDSSAWLDWSSFIDAPHAPSSSWLLASPMRQYCANARTPLVWSGRALGEHLSVPPSRSTAFFRIPSHASFSSTRAAGGIEGAEVATRADVLGSPAIAARISRLASPLPRRPTPLGRDAFTEKLVSLENIAVLLSVSTSSPPKKGGSEKGFRWQDHPMRPSPSR